MRNVAALII